MRRFKHWSALIGALLCLPAMAHAQINTHLPPVTQISIADLKDPRIQYYEFEYDLSNVNIYGAQALSQNVDYDLNFSPFTWGQNIGAFFNPCWLVDCTFGAGLRADVSAQPGVFLHARADVGSADIHCPFGVLIDYPKASDVQPGQDVTIQTELYLEPGATMNIKPPYLGARIGGSITGKLDVGIVAEAFGSDFLDINLFKILGLPQPEFNATQTLIDTGNLFDDIPDVPLVIPPFGPDVLSGRFHVPRLAASGKIRQGQLVARASDSFLTLWMDVTNGLVQAIAFGIPIPVEGSFGNDDFGGTFQLLDLQLQADAGVAEDLRFDPRPRIVFQSVDWLTKKTVYETKTVYAGDSVTFHQHAFGPLTILPTIYFDQNQFSNNISLTFTPSLSFDLIHVAGHGSVGGHDLFSFDEHPFGTQSLSDTFSAPLADFQFPVSPLPAYSCPAYSIAGNSIAGLKNLTSIVPSVVQGTPANGFTLTGQLSSPLGLNDSAAVNIKGEGYTAQFPAQVDPNGGFQVTIPPQDYIYLHPFRPLTVTLTIQPGNLDLQVPPYDTNPITVYWLPPALTGTQFGAVAFDPHSVPPSGHLTTFTSSGTFTVPLHSQGQNYSGTIRNSTFLYDDAPIPTTSTPTSDGYLLAGQIPDFLLDRGGTHTLSFLSSGLNATPVLLKTLTVDNKLPAVQAATPRPKEMLIVLHGSGFTLDTTAKVDGQTRNVLLVAPTELRVQALANDLVPGHHTVITTNPAPGGGSFTAGYDIAVPQPNQPRLAAAHSLTRREVTDEVFDMITLTNIGPNDLSSVQITSVTMFLNGKTVVGAGTPQTLPQITRTKQYSLLVSFPPKTSNPGDVAVIQIEGKVGTQTFTLSRRVTLPEVFQDDDGD